MKTSGSFTLLHCILKCLNKRQKSYNGQRYWIFFVVFNLTWKVRFFRAKKDFLKQHCAQDGMLQPRSQWFLPGKKVRNIGLYFWQVLIISWDTIHDTATIFVYTKMHAKRWRRETVRALKIEKKIMLFVVHHSREDTIKQQPDDPANTQLLRVKNFA